MTSCCFQATSLTIFVAATMAACAARPAIQPAPVYGPPSGQLRPRKGAYQRYQQPRAAPVAPTPFQRPTPAFSPAPVGLSPPPPPPRLSGRAPTWSLQQPFQSAPPHLNFQRDVAHQQQQSFFRQAPQPHLQPHLQPQQHQPHLQPQQQQPHLQPQQRQPQPQAQPQQYRTELQGVWRYTVPARPLPLREDEVPFQGLGATDSVTMPEAPPFDPLLLTGQAAAHAVRTLSDREPHYYPAFPHTRLVLTNQQKRLDNGLPLNRIGSIRPGSDFLRGD